jgi:hypothetical protein
MPPKTPPWIALRKKSRPELPLEPPILLGPRSNGEFYLDPTPLERRIRTQILGVADQKARRLGMDRRAFLASTMGMATSLSVLNLAAGCGNDKGLTRSDSGGSPSEGGGFAVSDAATMDGECAGEVLSGDELIIDAHTHLIEDEARWRSHHPNDAYDPDSFAALLTFYDCAPLMPRRPADCLDPQQYLDQIFLGSDTSVAVLTGYPSALCDDGTLCTNYMGNEDRVRTREAFNLAARSERVIQHCQIAPNDNWPRQREMMRHISEEYGNWGWKCYPPWGPQGKGYWLDDAAVTGPMFDEIRELARRQRESGHGLGRAVVCAHKGVTLPGFGFDEETADPRDVGPAALAHPDIAFLVYHSGYEVGYVEGPYDPDEPNPRGVNRLVRTVERNGLRGKNVYAELGVAWALAMGNPVGAQHLIGKLLKYLGEDRVLYGSECLWFGSPQPQIEALRALQISPQLQEVHGYPALTPRIKAKIFGLSAADVYGVDPAVVRCQVRASELAQHKRLLDEVLGARRWTFQKPPGPRSRREFLSLLGWRQSQNLGG